MQPSNQLTKEQVVAALDKMAAFQKKLIEPTHDYDEDLARDGFFDLDTGPFTSSN